MALALLAPQAAAAAGFWNLDRGPSNYGRGGANIADPDDPIAVYTNPAALAGLRGLQINIDANTIIDTRSFARADDNMGPRDDRTYTYTPVNNQEVPWPPSPGIFAAYNFASLDLPGLTIGLGVYGPPRSDAEYPLLGDCPPQQDCVGGQRYSSIFAHNLQIHYALAAAYELPWYRLRAGISFMLIDQIIDTALALNASDDTILSGGALPPNGDPDYDVTIFANAKASGVPSATFAVSGAPVEWLILSVAYQLPYSVNAKGTANLKFGFPFTGQALAELAGVEGEGIRVRLSMPSILRMAAQYADPQGRFDVEAAVVWEGWSQNRQIRFAPKEVFFTSDLLPEPIAVERVTLENNWHDTISVRLGGAYNLLPELLQLRAGFYYEMGAVPLDRLSLGSFDLDKIGGAAGARVDLPYGLWVDAALGFSYWLPVTVTNSQIVLANPLGGQPGGPIANGSYANTQIFFQAGVGVKVDI